MDNWKPAFVTHQQHPHNNGHSQLQHQSQQQIMADPAAAYYLQCNTPCTSSSSSASSTSTVIIPPLAAAMAPTALAQEAAAQLPPLPPSQAITPPYQLPSPLAQALSHELQYQQQQWQFQQQRQFHHPQQYSSNGSFFPGLQQQHQTPPLLGVNGGGPPSGYPAGLMLPPCSDSPVEKQLREALCLKEAECYQLHQMLISQMAMKDQEAKNGASSEAAQLQIRRHYEQQLSSLRAKYEREASELREKLSDAYTLRHLQTKQLDEAKAQIAKAEAMHTCDVEASKKEIATLTTEQTQTLDEAKRALQREKEAEISTMRVRLVALESSVVKERNKQKADLEAIQLARGKEVAGLREELDKCRMELNNQMEASEMAFRRELKAKLEAQADEKKVEIDSLLKARKGLEEKLQTSMKNADRLTEELDACQRRGSTLEKQLEEAAKKLSARKAQFDELQSGCAKSKLEWEELQTQAKAEHEKEKMKLEARLTHLDAVNSELATLRTSHKECTAKLAKLEPRVEMLLEDCAKLTQKCAWLRRERRQLLSDKAQLQLEEAEKRNTATTQIYVKPSGLIQVSNGSSMPSPKSAQTQQIKPLPIETNGVVPAVTSPFPGKSLPTTSSQQAVQTPPAVVKTEVGTKAKKRKSDA